MKELYTSPEVKLTCFISQERLAVVDHAMENEKDAYVLFGSLAVTDANNDITYDFS